MRGAAGKIPGGFDALFRQVTPRFLLLVLGALVFEPWLPGTAWLRATFGENVVLRGCTAALGLYVLLLWGESLRLHTMLTGVLQAFREHQAGGATAPARNPKARLVCVDLQPHGTTQAPEADDVLNVGGFSDAVFDLVGEFARGGLAAEPWVKAIEAIVL